MNTNTEFRLTDQLERELMLEAMNAPEPSSLLLLLKSSALTLLRACDKVLAFVGNLNDAMERAYSRNTRFASPQR
ncbi:hypothetical protein [Bordetella sp. FB-8]|uniref:hypothetical protein n=1 Tax=Bordetella sp. FB-8 TaxID=1159870 RepID=UPI00037A52BF|nr:hypothetical protein [Bordetella sp. FB-8]